MKSELIKTEFDLDNTYWWFAGRRAILDRILRRFGRRSGVAVDVGCGSGGNMELLAQHADSVLGMDRSSTALELASFRQLPVTHGDAQAMPVADSSVDLVSALDVLEHLDDDILALREFHRVLKPGGLVLITVPAYRFLWSEHDEALMHRRRYVASELHTKLTRSGFRVLKRSYAIFFTFFPVVFYRLFRGLFPKNSLAPQASHVMLPAFVNRLLTGLLSLEACMTSMINLPWGTSIVALAEKVSLQAAEGAKTRSAIAGRGDIWEPEPEGLRVM